MIGFVVLMVFACIWIFDLMEKAETVWCRAILGLFLIGLGAILGSLIKYGGL